MGNVITQYGYLRLYIAYAVFCRVTAGFQLFKLGTERHSAVVVVLFLGFKLCYIPVEVFALCLAEKKLILCFRNCLFECGQLVHTYRYIKVFFSCKQFLSLFCLCRLLFKHGESCFKLRRYITDTEQIILGAFELVLCVLFLR